MSEQGPAPHARRPELEQAFRHLQSLAAQVDVSGLETPAEQWLATLRATVANYGETGDPADLTGVTFTPVVADGVPACWITADGADNARRVVFLHGGGWAAGSLQSHRSHLATLARLSGASILFVDYRLAPEHRFPAGLDDCVTALAWARGNGPLSERRGLAGRDWPERLSVAGDSAGGNLAAATCVRQAATGEPMPDRLVLISATLDNVAMWDRVGTDDLICTPEALAFSVEHYLTMGHSPADPEVSPALAPSGILAAFPPTLLQVSSAEALVHDSRKFADRLEGARVRFSLSVWPDVPHVWHAFLGLFPEATEALSEVADFISR
jgi:acetyl esterase/lipase